MNKKVIIGIIAVVAVIGVVIGIICTKGGKLQEVTLTEELYSGESKISATFGYSKKAGFTEEKGELENVMEIKNEAKNYSIELALYADTTYEDNKQSSKEDEESYKEVKFSKYDGYIYKGSESRIEGNILLEGNEEDNQYKYITLTVEVIDSYTDGKEVDITSIYESKEVQTILNSIKYNGIVTVENEESSEEVKEESKGEFAGRTDGISDKDGLIFIPSFKSPDETLYKAEQRNDNVGIDNYLWYISEKKAYEASGIEVRIFPKDTEYSSFEEYKEDKGDMYHWSKTKIAGKEYDTYTFGSNPTVADKYSKYYSGAFMVGNKVVEFSYNMYKEVPDQSLGDKFFKQIMDSIEYSKKFTE